MKISLKTMYTMVSYMICFTGCMYQTYKISELYFAYETTTNFRFLSPRDSSTHTVFTICLQKVDQIVPDKLKIIRNNIAKSSNFNIYSNFQYNSSYKN